MVKKRLFYFCWFSSSFFFYVAPDGKSIVLFGGQSVSSDQTLNATNDVYLLDTCTLNWTHIITKGTPPVARAGHEAISFNNRYMIVMMGKVVDNRF